MQLFIKLIFTFIVSIGSILLRACDNTVPLERSHGAPTIDPLAPIIGSVTPNLSPSTGGMFVEITGDNFSPNVLVEFNHRPAPSVERVSSTKVKALVPAIKGSQGLVPVKVINHTEQGDRESTNENLFSYYTVQAKLGQSVGIRGISSKVSIVLPLPSSGRGVATIVTDAPSAMNNSTEIQLAMFDPTKLEAKVVPIYSSQEPISSMLSQDLNGDNKEDLIAGTSLGTVLIFINDGKGMFLPPRFFPAPVMGITKFLIPGDFNRDGSLDIVLCVGDYVGTLLGDGRGEFKLTKFSYAGSQVSSMVGFDFEQDSRLDLLSVSDKNRVKILRSNQDGTFQIPFLVSDLSNASLVFLLNLRGPDIKDLGTTPVIDGDYQLSLFEQKEGTFRSYISVPLPEPPLQVFPIDFNGDGMLDTMVSGTLGNLVLLLNNREGEMRPPQSFPIRGTVLGILDLNQDQRPDFLISSMNGPVPVLSFVLNYSE